MSSLFFQKLPKNETFVSTLRSVGTPTAEIPLVGVPTDRGGHITVVLKTTVML